MKKDIYEVISNDVMRDEYPDLYYINQENGINTPNSFQKKGWRHFIDGGAVRKNGESYYASYTYDIGSDYDTRIKGMDFTSFSANSGKDLLDFVYSVLNAEPKNFILTKGLEVYDLRKYMQRIKKINVYNTEIDDLFIRTLKKYFPNLVQIEFIKCHIKNECNFDSIKTQMKFSYCEIDDIRSFNDTMANLEIRRSIINKISNATIYSEEIRLDDNTISNSELKTLFLKCSFPNLNFIDLSPKVECYKYSYLDSFSYLGDAAKKLEYIRVNGKVSSFDFLLKLPNLISTGIHSIQDDLGTWYPDVDSDNELERIKTKNFNEYQIQKTLNPTIDDHYLVPRLEIQRILKQADILKLLSYTEEEKRFLLEHPDIIEFYKNNPVDTEVEDYYSCDFDRLNYYKKNPNPYKNFSKANYYRIVNNLLYEYDPNPLAYNNPILLCKNFIYYFNGKPIIFEHRYKPVRNLEEAQKIIEGKQIEKYELDDFFYEEFLELMDEFKEKSKDVDFGGLNDAVNEVITSGYPYHKYLSSLGEGGRIIKGHYDASKRYNNCRDATRRKNELYQEKMKEVLVEVYDNLTIEEKKYILEYKDSYRIGASGIKAKTNPDLEQNNILESINSKTNGKYENIFKHLKLSYKTYYMGAYKGIIKASTFEKLDTSKAKEKVKKSTSK